MRSTMALAPQDIGSHPARVLLAVVIPILLVLVGGGPFPAATRGRMARAADDDDRATQASGESRLSADEVSAAIERIMRAGPNSDGLDNARNASRELSRAPAAILPELLAAMGTANPVAANWLRQAFEAIAARELSRGSAGLPRDEILAFVRDASRAGRPRRLALRLLRQVDPDVDRPLLADWLDDPEFRRDAIDALMHQADEKLNMRAVEEARSAFERCFEHARHSDQVLAAVDKLRSLGTIVDPIPQLGFVHRWWVVGPFPAPGMSGFSTLYPPQIGGEAFAFDRSRIYTLDDGTALRWKWSESTDRLGEMNLVQALGPVKESVGFAYSEIECAEACAARLACSADDNLSIWLNGESVLAREQWLNGTRLDRFVVPVKLQAGVNRIFVKICQGPQHVNPEVPNNWSFQLRFCDASGKGIRFVCPLSNPDPASNK